MTTAAQLPEGDNRPSVYYDARTDQVVYRASALGGGCLLSLVAARLGYSPLPFNDDTLRRFKEGNIHEAHILAELEEQGWELTGLGDGQLECDWVFIDSKPQIIGRVHPDAFARRGNDARVVEVKAVSKDVFAAFASQGIASSYRYSVQVTLQMACFGKPALFGVKDRNSGKTIWQEIHDYPADLLALTEQVRQVEAWAAMGEPGLALAEAAQKCQNYPCQYRFLHSFETTPSVEDPVLETMLEDYVDLRTRKGEIETKMRALLERIERHIGDESKRTPRFSATWVTPTKKKFDREAALRAGLDVAKYETEAAGSRYLLVKEL